MDKHGFRNIQKKLGLTNEGTAKALGVELFTVQMWACGIWPIPRPIVKFLRTLLSMERHSEIASLSRYADGYDDGYKEGLEVGRAKGFNNGYASAIEAEGLG